jgi:hypothetical protein
MMRWSIRGYMLAIGYVAVFLAAGKYLIYFYRPFGV